MNTKLSPAQQKQKIYERLDYIIQDKIINANEAIVQRAMSLFSDTEEDTILTVGGVQLIQMIFMEAANQKKKFNVIVADMGPEFEGRELL